MIQKWLSRLEAEGDLPDEALKAFLEECFLPDARDIRQQLFARARAVSAQTFQNRIYVRGLIEFTSCCRNNCYYCGIRAGNGKAARYRLSPEEILQCCRDGYALGLRTFVLQGGEDPYFSAGDIEAIVASIHKAYPDCAITLSFGEHSKADYARWRRAGAVRYLLRHETADAAHYRRLHPQPLSLEHRVGCLWDLKALGYQTGAGFMVGSPGQTTDTLLADLRFLQRLKPEMIGIGPFIPHKDTPFKDEPAGSLTKTLVLLAILRLMHPAVLLPSTTALSTIAENGRELGILAGANVVMPNLSPTGVRKKYMLYNNKRSDREESAANIADLSERFRAIGYVIDFSRGDFPRVTADGAMPGKMPAIRANAKITRQRRESYSSAGNKAQPWK